MDSKIQQLKRSNARNVAYVQEILEYTPEEWFDLAIDHGKAYLIRFLGYEPEPQQWLGSYWEWYVDQHLQADARFLEAFIGSMAVLDQPKPGLLEGISISHTLPFMRMCYNAMHNLNEKKVYPSNFIMEHKLKQI